jgi:aryl-alcohol dehydrogenase-like predicted oxidoreductase
MEGSRLISGIAVARAAVSSRILPLRTAHPNKEETTMDFTTLGRTGLRVSIMGIGCGGPSRAGQSTGKTEAESVAIIRMALEKGVNFIDTAEAYATEEIVGMAIKGFPRDSLVLSTKKSTHRQHLTPEGVKRGLEQSLKRLGTDYVDIYHLHGVARADYDYIVAEIVPTLQTLRDQGKISFIGITEPFNADQQHTTLQRAVQDDIWDVMMVGFNILNQSARQLVIGPAMEKDIGILIMFAVRLALSRPERLREVIQELITRGQVDPTDIDADDPLGFLVHDGGAVSVPDAAYRFCRYEPGTHVVLSGTGNLEHLEANLKSFNRPPLPPEDLLRINKIFRRVDSVTGQ